MLCQQCKEHTATVHLTDLVEGENRERHLCEQCAGQEGVAVKSHVPINDMLNAFLMSQSNVQELAKLKCPECGISFVEFRNQGLLGCPHDYDVFGEGLSNVIERAQDGKDHHTGKVPGQIAEMDPVQQQSLQLARELRQAVEQEDYELAASLRDKLSELSAE